MKNDEFCIRKILPIHIKGLQENVVGNNAYLPDGQPHPDTVDTVTLSCPTGECRGRALIKMEIKDGKTVSAEGDFHGVCRETH